MVPVESGARSDVDVTPAPTFVESLDAQASTAHAMFSVSSDTMRNHVKIRIIYKILLQYLDPYSDPCQIPTNFPAQLRAANVNGIPARCIFPRRRTPSGR